MTLTKNISATPLTSSNLQAKLYLVDTFTKRPEITGHIPHGKRVESTLSDWFNLSNPKIYESIDIGPNYWEAYDRGTQSTDSLKSQFQIGIESFKQMIERVEQIKSEVLKSCIINFSFGFSPVESLLDSRDFNTKIGDAQDRQNFLADQENQIKNYVQFFERDISNLNSRIAESVRQGVTFFLPIGNHEQKKQALLSYGHIFGDWFWKSLIDNKNIYFIGALNRDNTLSPVTTQSERCNWLIDGSYDKFTGYTSYASARAAALYTLMLGKYQNHDIARQKLIEHSSKNSQYQFAQYGAIDLKQLLSGLTDTY